MQQYLVESEAKGVPEFVIVLMVPVGLCVAQLLEDIGVVDDQVSVRFPIVVIRSEKSLMLIQETKFPRPVESLGHRFEPSKVGAISVRHFTSFKFHGQVADGRA